MLTSKQRAILRGKANTMDPVFIVGKGEIDETMIQGVKDCLDARELIKLKVLENSMYNAREASVKLAEATGADCVQVIGSKFVLYLQKKKDSAYADLAEVKMKVLLYGGTFDPPHNGHLNNLRAAAARVQPDKVVVMPAGLSPFKQKTSASGALRLEMCSCFHALEEDADTIPQLEVSGWEIEQAAAGNRNYTVLTVEKLARDYPGAQLYLAIGSDMLLSFDGWHRWQDILRLAHLVVTSRHVGDDPELHAKALRLDPTGARILFAPVQALPMASSDIRTRLTAGEGCEAELPEAVRAVIRREKLYKKEVSANEPQTGKGACARPLER